MRKVKSKENGLSMDYYWSLTITLTESVFFKPHIFHGLGMGGKMLETPPAQYPTICHLCFIAKVKLPLKGEQRVVWASWAWSPLFLCESPLCPAFMK